MIVHTLQSVHAEFEAANEYVCGEAGPVPCNDPSCTSVEHAMFCVRPAGHPLDVHIATTSEQIVAVWRAS